MPKMISVFVVDFFLISFSNYFKSSKKISKFLLNKIAFLSLKRKWINVGHSDLGSLSLEYSTLYIVYMLIAWKQELTSVCELSPDFNDVRVQ